MFGVAPVLCIWPVPLEVKKSLALVGAVASSRADTRPWGRGSPGGTYRLLHLGGCCRLLHCAQLVPAVGSVVMFPLLLDPFSVLSSLALGSRWLCGVGAAGACCSSTAETSVHLPSPASRSSLWQLAFKLPTLQGYHWGLPAARPPCPCLQRGFGLLGSRGEASPALRRGLSMLPHGEVPLARRFSTGAGLGRAAQRGAGVPFPWLLAVPGCLRGSRHCCLPCLSLVCFYGSEGAVLPQFPVYS